MIINPDDEPATEAEENLGIREFLSDFQQANPILDDGVSLLRRPDAISLDYLTCFTLGPIQIGDFSQGPVDRPWKIRAVGNVVYSARLNNTRTDFDPETKLFSFLGVPPTEIDAAFDQAARILVCMERATGPAGRAELWVYYFDPFAGDYVLTNFGTGRTPRAALDDALDSNNADIIVFYMQNDIGMCYRMQRERYAVERIVTGTIPTVVDSSSLHLKLVSWNYPGPPIGVAGFLGYSVAVASIGGVNLQLDSLIDTTPGIYRPLPGTHFRAVYIGETSPAAANGGLLHVIFDKAVTGVELEMLDSQFDGATAIAYDKNFHELKRVVLTRTVGGASQLIQLYVAGIRTLVLLAPATDTTTWQNLKFTTDPLPVLAPDAWPPAANIFIEDVYKSRSNRLDVLYSVHDPVTGTYSLAVKSSVLYPFRMDTESMTMAIRPISGLVQKVLLYVVRPGELNPIGDAPEGFDEIESMTFLLALQNGTLISIIQFHTLFDIDQFTMQAVLLNGTVPQVLFFHTLFDIDQFTMNAVLLNGTVPVVLILHTLFDIDQFTMQALLQSGSLV